MQAALLSTKLYRPPIRSNYVSRPRLIEELNAGLRRKLTLVSAPAGFGKTTLLSDWANQNTLAAAWVSIDEGDNDLACFLTYLISSLQMIEQDLGEVSLAMLQGSQPLSSEPALNILLNEIAGMDRHFPVILDDYHLISNPVIHDTLAYLFDHQPHNLHLLIATRVDPPLPLAKLRVGGHLLEIRAEALRFQYEEVAEFLHQSVETDLSSEEVGALKGRTEGWIAGLQMAALSMQGREDIHDFITTFTGSHRYILDYLTEEVLNRQPEDIRRFLLYTSILDRMTASLCEAIVEASHAQDMLEWLDRANLFVVPLDDERLWYRYHHLFGDMLRRHLSKTQPDMIPELHHRASAWYEQNDLRPAAIDHCLKAEDFEQAADLIERTFNEVLSQGEFHTAILNWMALLPQDVVDARPRVGLLHGWMLALTGQIDAVEPRVQTVERAAARQLSDAMLFEIASLRAYLARQQGQIDRAVELSLQAAETFRRDPSSGSMQAYTGIVFNLCLAYHTRGNMVEAHKWYTEAVRVTEAVQSITFQLAALSGLARTQMMQGHLFQSQQTCQKGLQRATEITQRTGKSVPATAYVQVVLGEVLLEGNRLDEASDYLLQGLELARLAQNGITLSRALSNLVSLHWARGDMTAALKAINEIEELSKRSQEQFIFDVPAPAARARLFLAEMAKSGDGVEHRYLPDVVEWAEGRGFAVDAPVDTYICEAEYLIWTRLLIAQNEVDDAFQLLARLLPQAEIAERTGRVIEMFCLQALAYQALGDTQAALDVLTDALSLAEPAGYVRVFLNEGAPMLELLQLAGARGIHTNYVSQLLSAASYHGAQGASSSPLVDPLSERELEILRLIALGCSNPEIAEELVLAIGTVKSHTGNIYSKLGVRNRTEAVACARELDLL